MKKSKQYRIRVTSILALTCLFFIFLTGCGNDAQPEVSSLKLEKNGSVIQTIITDFPQNQYNIDDFMQMLEAEVNAYNDKIGNQAVTIKQTQLGQDTIKVVEQYQNANAYYDLNRKILFVGTIAQAKTAGYDVTAKLKSVEDGAILTKEQLNEMDDNHIAIVSEALQVKTFGKILYTSEGVTYNDNKLATVQDDVTSYIVFK